MRGNLQLEELVSFLKKRIAPEIYRKEGEVWGPHFGTFKASREIKKCLLTPDLSLNALHFALLNKIGFIISFYGLVRNPICHFQKELVDKFTILTRFPMLIYVLGSAFVATEDGVSDATISAFRPLLKQEGVINVTGTAGSKIPLGRVCCPFNLIEPFREPVLISDLIEQAKNMFSGSIIAYSNNYAKKIDKAAVFGADLDFVEVNGEIRWNEYDCVVAGAISTQNLLLFRDLDVSILSIPLLKVIDLALGTLQVILSLEFPHDEFIMYEQAKASKNVKKIIKNGGI